MPLSFFSIRELRRKAVAGKPSADCTMNPHGLATAVWQEADGASRFWRPKACGFAKCSKWCGSPVTREWGAFCPLRGEIRPVQRVLAYMMLNSSVAAIKTNHLTI